MDSPSAPSAPDPWSTAGAQAWFNNMAASYNTALNRPNQVTPWGSVTWSQGAPISTPPGMQPPGPPPPVQPPPIGGGWTAGGGTATAGGGTANGVDTMRKPGGTVRPPATSPAVPTDPNQMPNPQWTSTVTLSPDQQRILDLGEAGQIGNLQSANAMMAQLQGMFGRPLGSGAPQLGTVAGAMRAVPTLPGMTTGDRLAYNLNPNSQASMPNTTLARALPNPNLNANSQVSVPVPRPGLDNLGAMPQASDAARQRVEDALYRRQTSRLDPQYQQEAQALRSTLMNRGVVEGSEAWNNAMDQFERGRNDAYASARQDAILMGGDEHSRTFNMGMDARQQLVDEDMLNFGQGMNAHQQQMADAGQRFGQGLQENAQEMARRSGMFDQLMGRHQQSMADQGQRFNQSINANAQELFRQDQRFDQGIARHGQGMQDARQRFDMQNTANQLAFGNDERARNNLINVMSALRQGSQVGMPPMMNPNSGVSVPGANFMGAANNQFQTQLGQYNADVAGNNSMMGMLGGLGSAAIFAF